MPKTRFRKNDINLIPTLVIGANAEAGQAINELRERTDLGYRVVGILVNDDSYRETEVGAEVLGTIRDLPHLVRSLGIQEVIITDDTLDKEKLFESMMQIGRRQCVEFRFAPTLFQYSPAEDECRTDRRATDGSSFSRAAVRYRPVFETLSSTLQHRRS